MAKNKPGVLVLAGGGIDSTLCLYQLSSEGYGIRAIHYDFGQQASTREWASVRLTAETLKAKAIQIKISPGISGVRREVKGRNAAFISMALMLTEQAETLICIGVHAGTPFMDCSSPFIEAMDRIVAEQTDSRVRVIAPLLRLYKPEVVERAKSFKIPLSETYSCQLGNISACGTCHSCLDRKAIGC